MKGVAPPAGARQYRGVSFQCAACHKDPHLGQVGDGLRKVPRPRDEGLQGRPLRPHDREVRAHGQARDRALREVPREGDRDVPRGHGHGRSPHGHLDGVPRLPQGPAPRPALAALRDLPRRGVLQGREVRPPGEEGDRGLLRREARDDRLRRVPPEGDDGLPRRPGNRRPVLGPGRLRALPRGRPPRRPRARLRVLPQRDALADRLARLPQDRCLPARGQAPRRAVRVLPPQGRPQGHADGLLRLPLDPQAGRPLQDEARRPTAQTCHRPIALDRRHVEPRGRDGLHARDAPQDARLRVLPQGPGVQGHAARLLLLPPRGLRAGRRTRTTSRAASRRTARAATSPPSPTWQGATFIHATFPLAGVHTTQACAACHKNNVFKGTPRDCFSCHRTDYQNSKNPPHASAAFPTACETCHKFSAPNWQDAGFNHNVTTTFALGGVHVTQPCTACHVNNVYKGTPRDCYSCHKTDYQNSKSPPHAAAGFATTCDTCHKYTDPAWKPATFNHNDGDDLRRSPASHTTQACTTCHVNNVYKGTARDCYTCHKTDYQNSKNPPHAAAGLPDDLRHVPQVLRRGLEARELQPQHGDDLPARRRPRDDSRARRATEQRLQGHAAATATPATEGLHGRHEPGAPHRLPDDVRHLPQEHRRHLVSQTSAFDHNTYFAAGGRRTPRRPAAQCHNPPYAPPRTTTSACPRARARPATRPTTTTPRRPWTTSRRASRPPATRATSSPTRPGCWPRSATRPSRSSASTRRPRARRATTRRTPLPRTTTRPCRRPATGAT